MMRRCYDTTHHRYSLYGAVGTTVAPEWHDPHEFVRAVKLLPHWAYKQADWNGFELDKDYYGAQQYGPNTSVWLSKGENNIYTKAANPIEVTTADGTSEVYLTQAMAAQALGLSTSTLSRFLTSPPTRFNGPNKAFIGWEFADAGIHDGLLRLELIEDGDLGPVYGSQWRSWPDGNGGTIDQIHDVIKGLRENPNGRRHIVTAWNPAEIPGMALPPCHCLFQFFVANGKLSCQLYQRSADSFLGVPFNIASYALLTHMVAQVVGLEVGEFIHTFGDLHVYRNHYEQVNLQLSRDPGDLPTLWLNPEVKTIDGFRMQDISILNYVAQPSIKAPIAV